MTLQFTLFSQEVEDFVLEILTDADATFDDLKMLILNTCRYVEHPKQLFIVCDEDWHARQRILVSDEGISSDEDVYLMDETPLRDFIEEEGQHMAFRFDPEDKRHFLLEVTECSFGNPVDEPTITRRHGQAPDQFLFEEEPTPVSPVVQPVQAEEASEFYGDDGFEEGELDEEGFEIEER